jgi:excisionase family DNA binding protein
MSDAASSGLAETLEPLLSIEEAAAVLSISQRGLYRLIGRSDIAAIKVGGCTRIEPRELRRYIADHRQRASEETDNE